MKGIVGRKVGMTQVFDEETGRLTPVTVIQAGPARSSACASDSDGYDAVQLGFDEVPSASSRRAHSGTSRRTASGRCGSSSRSAGRTSSLPATRSPSRPSSLATR